MSNIADMGLDLDDLFQPAWAKGKSEANRFEKFTGDEGVRPERKRREGPPGERRERGPRREGGFGERRGGDDRPPRAGGGKFGDRRGGPRRDDRREDRREPAEAPAPLPEFNVAFVPEDKGVEQLARQIRMTGRAYPLFQIAQLILEKGERYSVQLTAKKKADGTPAQQVFVCALDDTPWTSEDEAVAHVLKNHFTTFYQIDRTPCDPPKGVYTFVAQCGMSGVILGPPNYHDYQNQLRKLHAEKFSRMPFDVFKSRVKIVKDEAVVKKWIEEQSSKIEYTALNVPEPLKLPTLDEVEKHFRATHKDSIIKPVENYTVAGLASRSLRASGLQRLIRQEWEHQRHFPLPIATRLSQQFASHGLQFFKVDRTYTHVSVARPQYLDIESNPVSDGIRRIVQFINANPKCTRKKLIEALAPTPKAAPVVAAPIPVPPAAPTAETPVPAAPAAPAAEGQAAPAPAPTKPAEIAQGPEPTPEQTAVMVDLHWLIHQGAVLEFADGRMETAKKPLPKPPKPEKKAEEKPIGEATATTETPAATEVPATMETPAATEAPATTETPAAAETAPAAEAPTPAPISVTAPEAAPEAQGSTAPAEGSMSAEAAPTAMPVSAPVVLVPPTEQPTSPNETTPAA
ncbi:MAG TPA: hypothetical protein VL970_03010 [Candidatus Acidoferrales bacterium]|nr:hypothetical protein [Candidatus Acidoferrales bacterium]